MAAVLLVLGQHERAGTDRPGIQAQVALGHARLRVEGVGLPRHRREEAHRQPVVELRVLAVQADAQRVVIERLGPGERERAKVQERQVAVGQRPAGAQRLVGLGDRLAVGLQALDLLGHRRERRRLDARGGQPSDRIHVVVRGQFAAALLRKVEGRALVLQVSRGQRVVAQLARLVACERRMRREADAALDADVVDRFGHLLARRIGRQLTPGLVVEPRLRHRLGGARHHHVRSLQVVKAVQRFVHRVRVRGLVDRVRGGRVQVLGRAFLKAGEEGVGLLDTGLVRTVDDLATARDQQGQAQDKCMSAPRQPDTCIGSAIGLHIRSRTTHRIRSHSRSRRVCRIAAHPAPRRARCRHRAGGDAPPAPGRVLRHRDRCLIQGLPGSSLPNAAAVPMTAHSARSEAL